MSELRTRPDFAAQFNKALIGFIEVKAPGKGADPRKFKDKHDKEQWDKLKALPNLVYTDGNAVSLWRNGVLVGDIIKFDGDIETSGAKLAASSAGSRSRPKAQRNSLPSPRDYAATSATR